MTLAPLTLLGRMTLAFMTLVGSVTMFATQAVVQGFRPPYYRQQIVRQMLEIGYYSLPVVGLTAIFTGRRASELRGLRWQDVDLDRQKIHVRQRADRFNDIGKPKSEAGDREVPMPPIVANALREWRLACPRPRTGEKDAEGNHLREEMKPEQLVFPNGQGKVESLSNIMQRGFLPAQIRAGVSVGTGKKDSKDNAIVVAKYSGFHSLRHFYALWCINRREDGGLALPPKSVQERLGHSTIALTMDTYSHLFPRANDASELASAEAALLA